MFAFIDEAGHTGPNLFDENQPIFYYGALMSREDVDVTRAKTISRIAEKNGTASLHAGALGHEAVDALLPELMAVLLGADCRIALSCVNKLDLAKIKLFDTVFDPGENVAVPWTAYNMAALRNILVFKVSALLDIEMLKEFWGALHDQNQARSQERLSPVLLELDSRVDVLPDARSRTILHDGLRWATAHPEVLHFHVLGRSHRKGHMPNAVAFPDLLRALHTQSSVWKQPVDRICVDRQSQFNETQKEYHELVANAGPGKLQLALGMDPVEFQAVPGSEFIVKASDDSAGIQIVDVLLWVFRHLDSKDRTSEAKWRFIRKLGKRIRIYDLSLKSLEERTTAMMSKIEDAEITDEMIQKGKEILETAEARRIEKMREYEAALRAPSASLQVESKKT